MILLISFWKKCMWSSYLYKAGVMQDNAFHMHAKAENYFVL